MQYILNGELISIIVIIILNNYFEYFEYCTINCRSALILDEDENQDSKIGY